LTLREGLGGGILADGCTIDHIKGRAMAAQELDTGSDDQTPEGRRVRELAAAVRRRRAELGLRQTEVADLAGCSARFLHTLEHGKTSLRLDKVLDVLEVLGLGLDVVPGRGRIEAVGGEPDAGAVGDAASDGGPS